jgi:hypothetical protein
VRALHSPPSHIIHRTLACTVLMCAHAAAAHAKYGWQFEVAEGNAATTGSDKPKRRPRIALVRELPVAAIRRPLGRTRSNGWCLTWCAS